MHGLGLHFESQLLKCWLKPQGVGWATALCIISLMAADEYVVWQQLKKMKAREYICLKKKTIPKNCSSTSVSCNCYYVNTTSNMPTETWMAQQHLLVLCVASCKVFRFAVHFMLLKIMTEGEHTSFLLQNEQKFSCQVLIGEDGQVWTCASLVNGSKECLISFWVEVGQYGGQYSGPCLDSHMEHLWIN